MGAIKAICPIGEAGILAAQAGHDLLLVCHDLQAQKEVYDKLLEAYKKQATSPERTGGERRTDQEIEIKERTKICGGRTRRRTGRRQPGGKNLP